MSPTNSVQGSLFESRRATMVKYEVEASDKLTAVDRISIHSNCSQLKNDLRTRNKSDNKIDKHAEHVKKQCSNMTVIENQFKNLHNNSVQNSRINSRLNSANGGRVVSEASEAAQVSVFLAKKNSMMSQNTEFSPNSPQNAKKINNDGIRIRAD